MRCVVKISFLFISIFLLTSCDKGYQVRFTNFYIEPMDSVSIGNKVYYTFVAPESTTDFNKISKGKYTVKCVSKSKKRFQTLLTIPNHGTGKRTVQIDGLSEFSILEE